MIGLGYLLLVVATAMWLRHWSPFFQRLNDFHWQLLVLVDIVAAVVIFWPLYLTKVIAERPLAGQTISAICGGHSASGISWAVVAAACIDALFLGLTGQRDHCAVSYQRWHSPLAG